MKRKQEPIPPAPVVFVDIPPQTDTREAALDKLAQTVGFALWKDFEDACLRVGGIIRRG